MIITKSIKMELNDRPMVPAVDVMQYDANTRALAFRLFCNGEEWTIPDGVTAAVSYRKADGTVGLYDTLPDGVPAVTLTGNTATAVLAEQALTAAGRADLSVVLLDGQGKRLATFSIILRVCPDPAAGMKESKNYINMCVYLPQPAAGAAVGQYLQVEEVNDAGQIIRVKAVDTPSRGAAITPEDTTFFIFNRNLCDNSTFTEGYFVNQTNGLIQNSSGYKASDYIAVKPNVCYVVAGYYPAMSSREKLGSDFRYAVYDENKTYITGGYGADANPFTVPENGVYVRFSCDKTKIDIQFEEGTEPTEYSEASGTYLDPAYLKLDGVKTNAVMYTEQKLTEEQKAQARVNINAMSANKVVSAADTNFFVISKNLFVEATKKTGCLIYQLSGSELAYADYTASDYIPIKPNTTYVISQSQTTITGSSFRYAVYDENKTFIEGDIGVNPITTPAGAAYLRFSYWTSTASNVQCEEGTSPSEYEVGGTCYLAPDHLRLDAGTFPLNLPAKLYALVGEELNIYFDNLVDGRDTDYIFNVNCSVGMQLERCYRLTATTVGSYEITIEATDHLGATVAKTATIEVAAASAGSGKTASVIVMGDSTTNNGITITKLNENFADDVLTVVTLGTRGTSPNNHEGRSGWKFSDYMTVQTDSGDSSVVNPFYNPDAATFDAAYYFANSGVSIPDWFFINLGINDTFGFLNDEAVANGVAKLNGYCDSIIASLKAAAPNIRIGVCLTIPPNYSQDAFGKAYSCGQTRDRYKRNNVLWVQNQIEQYDGREDENIYLVPIYTNLDTKYNMGMEEIQHNKRNAETYASPIGNGGVHPVESGYWQIADVYWFFLKNQA